MTKPIEGWVLDVNDMIPTTVSDYQEGEVLEVIMKEPHDSLMKYRPVKITFTDELATKEQYERAINAWIRDIDVQNAIQDAIRKERERIYSDLQPHIGEDSYSETDDGGREYTVPSDRCLRGIIFGEEK